MNTSIRALSEEALPVIQPLRKTDVLEVFHRLLASLPGALRITVIVSPQASPKPKMRVAQINRTGLVAEGDACSIPSDILRSCTAKDPGLDKDALPEVELHQRLDLTFCSLLVGSIRGLKVHLVAEIANAGEAEAAAALLPASRPSLVASIEATFTEALPDGASSWLTALTARQRAPLFIVGQSGRVTFANNSATELLAQSGAVSVTRNGELAVEFADGMRWGPRVVELIPDDNAVMRSVNSQSEPMLAIMRAMKLEPTTPGTWHWLFDVPLHYIITFYIDSRPAAVAPELIRDAFGLTKTESDLVAALTGGETLGSYAESTGSKESTARWHMKRILQKTHCCSKLELVSRAIHLGYAGSL